MKQGGFSNCCFPKMGLGSTWEASQNALAIAAVGSGLLFSPQRQVLTYLPLKPSMLSF
jgi:hypothetical protein